MGHGQGSSHCWGNVGRAPCGGTVLKCPVTPTHHHTSAHAPPPPSPLSPPTPITHHPPRGRQSTTITLWQTGGGGGNAVQNAATVRHWQNPPQNGYGRWEGMRGAGVGCGGGGGWGKVAKQATVGSARGITMGLWVVQPGNGE